MNKQAGNIVVLTGAGVSAESGLATFRAADGLWENEPVEAVATPEGFARDRERVHRFYNERRRQLSHVQPNAAHIALADFEKQHAGQFLLVTQNVDDLHERAGSINLLHMHGELLKVRCIECQTVHAIADDISTESVCHHCNAAGQLRPDIVWFGEMPFYMDAISQTLSECSLFVAIGTSGNVYPAAGFVQMARAAGASCVELNLAPSTNVHDFHHRVVGAAGETVPAFFADYYSV